ncbi:MAG: ATP-binding protein, partial [Patescibacteria group bacterium]
ARGALTFPARFTLVASMNPCPCGYFEDPEKECRCTAHEILRYQKKISGPLLDRIDIQITVPRIPVEELLRTRPAGADDEVMQGAVVDARARQRARATKSGHRFFSNAEMPSRFIDERLTMTPDAETFLKQTLERAFLSARGYYRTLRVAQTIADLEGVDTVSRDHLAEAFQYRLKTEG